MWKMKYFLSTALCVVLSAPTQIRCFNQFVDEDRNNTFDCTLRSRYGRVVVLWKQITYADLNTGVPVADHVKRHVNESYVSGDIIDTVIDPKLGGSGEEMGNVIPMNYETHLLWRIRVTDRIYVFLQENPEKDVWFRVELFYEQPYELRPFFLGVKCGYGKPPFDSSCTRELSYHEQYLVYGFISNPSSPYLSGFNYEYAGDDDDYYLPREPLTPYLYSIKTRLMKGPTQYVMTGNPINNNRNVTRVESTWKEIKVADLVTIIAAMNTTVNIKKNRTEEIGFVEDVQGELISPQLGGSGEYNVVNMIPNARRRLDYIVMDPIANHLKNIWNMNHIVYLKIDLMYNDSVTSRPVGFLVSISVKVKHNSSGEGSFTDRTDLPATTFVDNIPRIYKKWGGVVCELRGKPKPSLLTKLKEMIFGRPFCSGPCCR